LNPSIAKSSDLELRNVAEDRLFDGARVLILHLTAVVVHNTLLSMVGNSIISGNTLVQAIVERLAGKLPPGWRITSAPSRNQGHSTADAVLRIRGPGPNTAFIFVEAKRRIEPKDLDSMAAATLRPVEGQPFLVVAPFLSPRTQERLRTLGVGYADLTGNVRLSLSKPGLYIETHGADKNPEPTVRDRRSLKGAKAGRLIRALCDFRPPLGLRELAKRAVVNAGYASRIVDFLDREALVVRKSRGPITSADWSGLLTRWSQEYSPFQRGPTRWFLAARGLTQLTDKLRSLSARYAVSGSWAATQFAPVAPPRLLLCYADDISHLAQSLDVRPSDAAGSNVALVTPFDPVVYERTSQQKGTTVVAPSQIAADLLTSPGRGPNEAEALMEWMRENEHAWRT
jgi:hypothetical protein